MLKYRAYIVGARHGNRIWFNVREAVCTDPDYIAVKYLYLYDINLVNYVAIARMNLSAGEDIIDLSFHVDYLKTLNSQTSLKEFYEEWKENE